MRRWLTPRELWLVLWSLSWFVASGALGAEPSDAIPETASVVLRLKAPQATLEKLANYVDAVQPGFGAAVKGNLPTLGLAISNPGLAGVDVDKDWWAIAFVQAEQKPALVFVVPAKDSEEIKKALPDGFQFHLEDKLAIYSDNAEALSKVRERVGGKGTALWSQIDADSKKLFEASDASVLIHVRQLTQAFDSQLQEAEPKLNTLLDQLAEAMPEPQRPQMVPMLDMYRVLGKSALQGVRDSNTLTLGVTFSKDLIRCEDRLQVAEGTPTSKFFAKQTTGELSLMGRLPAKKLAYFGVKADMSGLVDWSMNLSKAWMANASDEQKAQIDSATKEMRGLKWGEMAGYFDLDPTAAGAARGASVAEITPTDRLREISRSMMKAMSEIKTPGFKQTMTLEPAVEKIGGTEVDRITLKQEMDPSLDPLGIQKKFMTLLFGEDGMKQHVMYQSNRVLQTFGGGTSELASLLKAIDSTNSKAADITEARKRFFEKANFMGLADLAQVFANGVKLAAREKIIPLDAAALDALELQPSFIGLAVACEPTSARLQFDIPVTQAQGIAKIVGLLIARRQ